MDGGAQRLTIAGVCESDQVRCRTAVTTIVETRPNSRTSSPKLQHSIIPLESPTRLPVNNVSFRSRREADDVIAVCERHSAIDVWTVSGIPRAFGMLRREAVLIEDRSVGALWVKGNLNDTPMAHPTSSNQAAFTRSTIRSDRSLPHTRKSSSPRRTNSSSPRVRSVPGRARLAKSSRMNPQPNAR